MATSMRLDLVATYKKETILNLNILNKMHPMLSKIAQVIFIEHGMQKPTQNLFNHLSYYLVSIIDSKVHASFTWPLYDTKAERAYRIELSKFITDYASKGLLTPVMSSYLVNPGCYKVTVLLFQLTQLAVKRLLVSKLNASKKDTYNNVTAKYKSFEARSFIDFMASTSYEDSLFDKLSCYLHKKHLVEQMAVLFRNKIIECENKLSKINAQSYIDKLIDSFVEKYELDELSRNEILQIKNVNEQPTFFDNWLIEVDKKLDILEGDWNNKVLPFMEKCRNMHQLSEAIIQRHTGAIDRSTYTIDYNPKTDAICTDDLQIHVNSEQKFILRNLQNDGRLNFPNLLRAYFISVCYILKNNEIDDDISNFNNNLDSGKIMYREILSALRVLMERVDKAESRLKSASVAIYVQSDCIEECLELPPLPDVSNLKFNREQHHVLYDAFTPLNFSKYQFKLRQRSLAFKKPQHRSNLTAFCEIPKVGLMRSLLPNRVMDYDYLNVSHSSHNMSTISNIRANETIGECSSGFTKQQITRLLSTKKSSSKKFSCKEERPDIKIIKGGLFDETFGSNDSNGLFRSYSSPNLYESKEKRSLSNLRCRKLSIMQEDSPSQLELSGIACLNSNYNTPTSLGNAESSRNNTPSFVPITNAVHEKLESIAKNVKVDYDKSLQNMISPILESSKSNVPLLIEGTGSSTIETPKGNAPLIGKTSSLEKIIKRFKKVRANTLPNDEEDIRTIVEEKENVNLNIDSFSANRNLLPDLLSPSYSLPTVTSNNSLAAAYLEVDDSPPRRPRESLGTALGVDPTFLDQFDLIE